MSLRKADLSAGTTHLTRALRVHPLPPQAGGEGYLAARSYRRALRVVRRLLFSTAARRGLGGAFASGIAVVFAG